MNYSRFLRWSFIGLTLVTALAGPSVSAEDSRARAAEAIEQAAKGDANNAELWLHLGFARQKLGQTDAAQQAFEKASALDPKNDDALYMLGLIYEKKNQTQDALRVWKQYLAAGPSADRRGVAEKHIHRLSQ